MRALVTGASGFIGRALTDRLLAAGWRVTAISRRRDAGLPAAVQVCVADLATGDGLRRGLCDGVDVVFHCAGEVRDTAAMRQVHVEGTRRLLACVPHGNDASPRWVQLSSVGTYGPPDVPSRPRVVDEATPENPSGEYEITKTESDRLVQRFAGEYRMPCTTLRPSNVIGARMPNASVRAMIAIVERGWFFHIGDDGAIANYVHVDDVADALVACATRPQAAGETFNISSDCSWVSLVEQVARVRGIRPPRLRVPERVVRAVVAVAGVAVPLPLSPARISVLVGRTSYPAAKIDAVLGFRCSKPMPSAIEELMAAGR